MNIKVVVPVLAIGLQTACQMQDSEPVERSVLYIDSFEVAKNLTAGVPYAVRMRPRTKNGNVSFKQACFSWSGEGPYCFPTSVVEEASITYVDTILETGNPKTYELEGFLKYEASDGRIYETNRMAKTIVVRP